MTKGATAAIAARPLMKTPSSNPDIHIVIVALVGGEALKECLRRLSPWQERCDVILGAGMDQATRWQSAFPKVRFSDGSGLTVPLRRLKGVRSASSEVVALLEDSSFPEPGWLEAARSAFENPVVAAAAGPVLIDPALDARFQSLACTEYGRYHPRLFPRFALEAPDGRGVQPVSHLPGNNLAYRRERLLEVIDLAGHGLVEGEVNRRLVEGGGCLAYQPRMAVTYSGRDRHGARLGTRMRHGRLFAGHRAAGRSTAERLALFAGSFLLPAILSARALAAMAKAVRPSAWPHVAAWICLMETAWALGESAGYLYGTGNSMEAWH